MTVDRTSKGTADTVLFGIARHLAFALTLLLCLSGHSVLAADVPVTSIPAFLLGTYDLTMANSTLSSPYPDDTDLSLTLAIDGSICTDGLRLRNPYYRNGNTSRVYWTDEAVGLEFSIAVAAPFSGIQLANENSVAYGDLLGQKSEGSVDDCDLSLAFFNLAESLYPDLFPEGLFVLTQLQSLEEFHRYYSLTGIYLRISGGIASAQGGQYGNTPVELGEIASLLESGLSDMPLPVESGAFPFDDYYVSTYELVFGDARSFSPVANGTQATFVITLGKQLCTGDVVLATPLFDAGSQQVIWRSDEGDFRYSLDLIPVEEREARIEEGQLSMYTADGLYLGTWSGTRTLLSAECQDAGPGNPDLPEIDIMFGLAEQRLPDMFPGGPLVYNQKLDGYVLRHYAATGISVRVRQREVEVKGGSFGEEYASVGTLNEVIALLQGMAMSLTVPSALIGTYELDFSPAGEFSPLLANNGLQFSISEAGTLCVEGQTVNEPFIDLDDPSLATWRDSATGLVFQVDMSGLNGSDIDVLVQDLEFQHLGVLSGSKTDLLPSCGGLVAGTLDIHAINELFTLLERERSDIFPPSALTYNQLNGSTLLRYYPGTSVLVSIDANVVSARGGIFGPQAVAYGTVTALLEQLRALESSSYSTLAVTGVMSYQVGNVPPVNRTININRDGIEMPTGTSNEDLTALVEQALGDEISGVSFYGFINVLVTDDELKFDVFINNQTTVVSRLIQREYVLSFIYTRTD